MQHVTEPLQQPLEHSMTLIPIVQMRKQNLREVKNLPQITQLVRVRVRIQTHIFLALLLVPSYSLQMACIPVMVIIIIPA